MFPRILQRISALRAGLRGGARERCAPLVLDQGTIGRVAVGTTRDHCLVVWDSGGTLWSAPVRPGGRSAPTRFPIAKGHSPVLSLNGKGGGVLLWLQGPADSSAILAAVFTAEQPLPDEATPLDAAGRITHLQATVDRRGSALVLWCQESGGRWEVRVQGYDVRQQRWDPCAVLLGRPAARALAPVLVSNPKGAAMALWQHEDGAFEGPVAFCNWPAEKIWSDTPVRIAQRNARELVAAMDARGDTLVAWADQPYGRPCVLEATRFRADTCEWAPPVALVSASRLFHLRMAQDPGGETLLAWRQVEESGGASLLGKTCADGVWAPTPVHLDPGFRGLSDYALNWGSGPATILMLSTAGKVQAQPGPRREAVGLAEEQENARSPILQATRAGTLAFWLSGGPQTSRLMAAAID